MQCRVLVICSWNVKFRKLRSWLMKILIECYFSEKEECSLHFPQKYKRTLFLFCWLLIHKAKWYLFCKQAGCCFIPILLQSSRFHLSLSSGRAVWRPEHWDQEWAGQLALLRVPGHQSGAGAKLECGYCCTACTHKPYCSQTKSKLLCHIQTKRLHHSKFKLLTVGCPLSSVWRRGYATVRLLPLLYAIFI